MFSKTSPAFVHCKNILVLWSLSILCILCALDFFVSPWDRQSRGQEYVCVKAPSLGFEAIHLRVKPDKLSCCCLATNQISLQLLQKYAVSHQTRPVQILLCPSAVDQAELSLQVFERFATAEWDLRILSGFLTADQLLGEPTRVPCCDYPQTYAPV